MCPLHTCHFKKSFFSRSTYFIYIGFENLVMFSCFSKFIATNVEYTVFFYIYLRKYGQERLRFTFC